MGWNLPHNLILSFKIVAMHLIKIPTDQDGERLLRARLGEMVVRRVKRALWLQLQCPPTSLHTFASSSLLFNAFGARTWSGSLDFATMLLSVQ